MRSNRASPSSDGPASAASPGRADEELPEDRRAPRPRSGRRPVSRSARRASRARAALPRPRSARTASRRGRARPDRAAGRSVRRRSRAPAAARSRAVGASLRRNRSGICIRMPGAVAGVDLAAAGAAVQQVDEQLQRLLDDRVRLAPLMWATKPTPHASCSNRGSYRPCAPGRRAGWPSGTAGDAAGDGDVCGTRSVYPASAARDAKRDFAIGCMRFAHGRSMRKTLAAMRAHAGQHLNACGARDSMGGKRMAGAGRLYRVRGPRSGTRISNYEWRTASRATSAPSPADAGTVPTSVTSPIVCDDPRSASLVTTAGLMSTHTTGTHAGQHVSDADAMQHRRQHDHQAGRGQHLGVAILRRDRCRSSCRAIGPSSRMLPARTNSTPARTHSTITPLFSTPDSTAPRMPPARLIALMARM